MVVRPSKTTKEMEASEIELLAKPEARETALFDPTELQGLIEQTREEDDLALPIEPAPPVTTPASSAPMLAASTDAPPASTLPPRIARGSSRTPKAHRPLTKPAAPRTYSLVPWLLVALAAAAVVALAIWY